MANQIDADLIELSEGLIDEAVVRGQLENYIRFRETVSVVFSETEHPTTTHATAATETFRNHLETPRPVVDLHLVYEFA